MFLETKKELYRAKIMYYIIVWYSVLLVDNLKSDEEKYSFLKIRKTIVLQVSIYNKSKTYQEPNSLSDVFQFIPRWPSILQNQRMKVMI